MEPFKRLDQVLQFERLDHLSEYHNMRVDRMTMAHGVEAKVPFEDHRLVDFSLHIPVKTLFGKYAKEWLGEVARPWVPAEIIGRPKVHFSSLPKQWISGKGIRWASDVLLDHGAISRKWLKPEIVQQYIKEHNNKTRDRGRLLWALMRLFQTKRNPDGKDVLVTDGTLVKPIPIQERQVSAGGVHTIEAGIIYHLTTIPSERLAATLVLDSPAFGPTTDVLINSASPQLTGCEGSAIEIGRTRKDIDLTTTLLAKAQLMRAIQVSKSLLR